MPLKIINILIILLYYDVENSALLMNQYMECNAKKKNNNVIAKYYN